VDTKSIAKMTDAVNLLAFKLAGLTYYRGEQVEIAKEFGEVFIQTKPSGAEIYVNGSRRGVSPDLVSRVPLGKVKIECRKGNLYGIEEIEITETSSELFVKLSEIYGNLFIKSSEKNVKVYLDDSLLGELESGFFKNIPIGEYSLELFGDGLYWKETVSIRPNESTRVEAYPRAFGIIQYELPEGAVAEIVGNMYREVVGGEGVLPLWAGFYDVNVSGKIYETYALNVTIKRGAEFKIRPSLRYNREYESKQFTKLLAESGKIFSEAYRIKQSDIDNLVSLRGKIKESHHSFPELIARAELLIDRANEKIIIQGKRDSLEKLIFRKQELEEKISRINRSRKTRKIVGWASLGAGLVSAGLSGLFWYLSDRAYENYQDASITTDAVKYRKEVQSWDTFTYVAGGTAGIGVGLSILMWVTAPKPDQYESELNEVNLSIDNHEKELR